MTATERLLIRHPAPWSVDQMNDAGVKVVDCHGYSVFEEWFGECPDELSPHAFSSYIEDRHLFAIWLQEWALSANTPVTDAEPPTPANTRAQGPRSV